MANLCIAALLSYYSETIKLSNNSLVGNIPNDWTDVSVLESLDLSGNELKGYLPSTLASIPKLSKLHLSHNLLSGSIPSSFYKMQSLQDLYINDNSLGGPLSQSEQPLYIGIRNFVISNNSFTGRFPVEQFENAEFLSKWRLFFCAFMHAFVFLRSFAYKPPGPDKLELQHNDLTGTITQSICQRLEGGVDKNKPSVDCSLIECTCCTCF